MFFFFFLLPSSSLPSPSPSFFFFVHIYLFSLFPLFPIFFFSFSLFFLLSSFFLLFNRKFSHKIKKKTATKKYLAESANQYPSIKKYFILKQPYKSSFFSSTFHFPTDFITFSPTSSVADLYNYSIIFFVLDLDTQRCT